MDKSQILDFVKKHKLAVLSTVSSENKSQSAVLEFGETDDFEIIFDTFSTARKYKNLKQNNNVSLVIGWDENITVQYEGTAEELKGEEAEKYKEIYWKKNPEARRWAEREGIVYFKVKPVWIRYSDLNRHPWEIHELEF